MSYCKKIFIVTAIVGFSTFLQADPPTSNFDVSAPILSTQNIQIITSNYLTIHTYITKNYKNITTENAHLISYEICKQTQEHDLDPLLFAAIIAVESRFNHNAVGGGKAAGLGQFMPLTAKRFGVQNPFNIQDNIAGMGRYISKLEQMFQPYHNKRTLVLVSYNSGETYAKRYRTHLGPKSLGYVKKVLIHYQKLEALHEEVKRPT
jgi:soluble lytic murein transglycosylase-like protein